MSHGRKQLAWSSSGIDLRNFYAYIAHWRFPRWTSAPSATPETLQVSGWSGPQNGGGGGSVAGGGRLGSDAAVLAAAAQRRRAAAYRLSSSSSSSDSEEVGAAAQDERPAPTEQELTAKLFAKLGIKQPHGYRAGGFESDSSWASSPERSRLIKAGGPGSGGGGSPEGAAAGDAAAAAELAKAQATIVALQRELAAARAQADGTTQQLREVQQYAQGLEVRCSRCCARGLPRRHPALLRRNTHLSPGDFPGRVCCLQGCMLLRWALWD